MNRMSIRAIWPALVVCLNLTGMPASAQNKIELQRTHFIEAESTLNAGDTAGFHALAAELHDYPLYPYLLYAELLQNLSSARGGDISRFLDAYRDTPLAARLRQRWLTHLATHERWQDFLRDYHASNDKELQCLQRQALHHTDQKHAALKDVEKIWLTGRSQADACDPVFEIWRASGGLTPALIWQRLELAMTGGNTSLARYLAKQLPESEQTWFDLWMRTQTQPELIMHLDALNKDQARSRLIVLHAVKRAAQRDPAAGDALWDQVKNRYHFSETERSAMARRLALGHALRGKPEALNRLAALDPQDIDGTLREWRVRAALSLGDWQTALIWIDELNPQERQNPRWQYWRARALEAIGNPGAGALYEALSRTRNYYGFLAADRIETRYAMESQPLTIGDERLADVENLPGIQRARELFMLERALEARREWYLATRGMSDVQLTHAAKLAERWGWHDQAIITVAATPFLDDLQLRFPIVHQDMVLGAARDNRIDPAWAFAVIRQESAFMTDARSPAGALGLMQLLPRTARDVARDLNLRLSNPQALFDAGTNIRLGVTYLRNTLDRFDDNAVLATASYNAGSRRVNDWRPANDTPADIWVETVPFYETRGYLQQVFAYTVIYDYRLGRAPTPLKIRMSPISGQGRNNATEHPAPSPG